MKRDLGGGERTYWIANHWSPNNVLAIGELDGWLEASQLSDALAALQRAHPLLGVRVVPGPDGRNPRFMPRRAAGVPLEVLDVRESALSVRLDALIEDELNHAIDASEGLSRVVYAHDAQRSALILSCLHIIADATAVMIALRDLLVAYERAGQTEPIALPRRPRRPPYEALLPTEQRGLRGLPNVLRTQWAAITEAVRRKPVRLPKQAQVPTRLRRNGYMRRALAPADVDRLRRACAAHGVTVHGALTAALGLAVAHELGLRNAPFATLNVGSPLSVRHWLRPSVADELGSYVCTLNVYMDVGASQSLWSVARQVNQELQRRRQRGEPLAVLNTVALIAPRSRENSKWVVDLAESQGPGNLCLSNIGAFDMPSQVAGIALRSAHWCASLSITGYLLCAVCTTGRGLQLDFAYIERIVSRDRAMRIADRMRSELDSALPAFAAPAADRGLAARDGSALTRS